MRLNKFSTSRITFVFIIFVVFILFSNPVLATIGTPHIIYGKVFNSSGASPDKANLEIYAYIPARPGEILDKYSVGSGYDLFFDGWLWFEAGNFITPWAINENVRLIVVDNLLYETGVIDLALNSSGKQLLSDLYLGPGDNVGPIASNALVDNNSPASIPEGTPTITLTASIDDSISGNNSIQGAEYFIDTDPGLGLGNAMWAKDTIFNSPFEEVTANVDTSSWTEGSTHTIYVRGQDSDGNWGTTHIVVVSVTKPVKIKGDLDGDSDVDRNDLNILRRYRNKPASNCAECDLDGDGRITVLDVRKLVRLCTRPRCAIK